MHSLDYLKLMILRLKRCHLGLFPECLSNSLQGLLFYCCRLLLWSVLIELFGLLESELHRNIGCFGRFENFLCFQARLLADIQNRIAEFSLQSILEIKECFKLEILNCFRYRNFIFKLVFLAKSWYRLQLFLCDLIRNYVLFKTFILLKLSKYFKFS